MRDCEICGVSGLELKEVPSAISSFDFFCCEKCYEQGTEPYHAWIGLVISKGGYDNLEEDFKRWLRFDLVSHSKVLSEFLLDVKEAENRLGSVLLVK